MSLPRFSLSARADQRCRPGALVRAGSRWLRRAWPVLLILALPVVLLAPSLFGGRAATAGDVLLVVPPWSGDLGTAHLGVQNPLLSDDPFQISPAVFFTRQQLFAGRFPFWNPYVAAGTPFFAADLPAVPYPLTWLEVLLPYPFGMTVAALLRWWVAGLGMYVFTRRSLRLARLPALVASVAFILSSFIVDWLLHPVGQAAILLPWLLWATQRTIHAPSAGRIALLASLEALICLAGQPEMAFHVSLGVGCFALWWGLSRRSLAWQVRLRRLACWAGGMALGMSLAALQLLPTLAVLSTSLFQQVRATQPPYPPLPASALATWLAPNLWGNPALLGGSWGPGTYSYNEGVYYAGTVALVLAGVALLALRRPERRGEVAFFALLVLFMWALLYGLPPFIWLTHLPVLNQDAWERLGVLAILGVAALAGFGTEELLTWGASGHAAALARPGAWQKRQRWVLAGLVVLLGVLLWVVAQSFDPADWPAWQRRWSVFWLELAVVLVWTTSVVVWLRWQGRLSRRLVSATLLGLLLADLLLFATPYTPQPPARLIYPQTPTITRLQQTIGAARMAAQGAILPPDSTVPYQLHDLRAYDPTASARYLDYMLALDPELAANPFLCCRTLTCPRLSLLSVASVAYYATLPDMDANRCARLAPGQARAPGPLVPLWTQGGLTLWCNTQARPRFYFADQVSPSSSAEQTRASLPRLQADGRDAIIEGAPAGSWAGPAEAGTIRVLADAPGEITLRAQTETPRWLVVNEGYDPGWQAEVDGVSQAIHPANELFQAVLLPAGLHTLHLTYRPVGFVLGASLSALAGLVLVCLLVLGAWGSRRGQPPEQSEKEPDGASDAASVDIPSSLKKAETSERSLASGGFEFSGNHNGAGGARAASGGFGRDGGQIIVPKLAGCVNENLALAALLHIKDGAAHRLAFAQEPELIIALWRQRLQAAHDQHRHMLFRRAEQTRPRLGRLRRAGQLPHRRMRRAQQPQDVLKLVLLVGSLCASLCGS